ncbi:M81 family metallopeptidase [Pseudoruegeria sp. HB172150]|uniref:M81 family metallopeptidase n=1 Tax=Pseudoruegeria sp. HB172150 TaxID=2721164 RepID=UPI001555836D|nr:M81 family metallopeptidase [Pseudoruegeria sp. HB172150]
MRRIAVMGMSNETMLASPGHIDLSTSLFWRGEEIFGEELFLMRGVLQRLREEPDVEIVPIMLVRCRATPVFSRAQFDEVKGEILERLAAAGPLDGVVAANHGAMEVEDGESTADTELMTDVRRIVGTDVPITVGLDLHGHVTPGYLNQVDGFAVYRTAPHRDDGETGYRAADHLMRIMAGAKPRHAAVHIPLFLPGETAMTIYPPADELYAMLSDYDAMDGVVEANLFIGFAWNDLPWAGMHALVTTDGDVDLARKLAQDIAAKVWARRSEFGLQMPSYEVEEGLRKAMEMQPPVLLSDSGDNVTAGAFGDLTLVLQQALDMPELEDIVIVNIVAPGLVDQARQAGAGAMIEVDIGAEHLSRPATHRKTEAEVLATGAELNPPGVFRGSSAPWAVLKIGHVTASFHHSRLSINSPQLLEAMGIDSAAHRLYVYKVGYLHPKLEDLGFGHVLLLSDGTSNLDLTKLDYHRIVRPAYPFDPDMTWSPEQGLYDDGRG